MSFVALLVVAWLLVLAPIYALAAAVGDDRFAGVTEQRRNHDWNGWTSSLQRMADRVPVSEPTWERVRRRHRLVRVGGHCRRLRGLVEGCPVELTAIGRSKTSSGLRISLKLSRPLPPGTCVQLREGRRSRVQFGDVILNIAVSATSRDPETLVRRLDRASVRQALLEVIHAAPGSRITSAAIELELPAPAGDPEPWLDRVIALERALRSSSGAPR